jgi:hypothetical protein
VAGSSQRSLDTLQCPSCGKTVIAGMKACQFCGAPMDARARAGSTQAAVRQRSRSFGLEELIFVLCAVLWVAGGGYDLAATFGKTPMLIEPFGGMAYFGILAGFRALLGLGMLFRIDLAGTISRVLALVQIAFSGVTVVLALVNESSQVNGIIYQAAQLALAALVFWIVAVVGD